MSCGLGAVILLFMLVKHSAEITVEDEIITLDAEVETLNEREVELKEKISAIKTLSDEESRRIQSIQAEISRIKEQMEKHKSQIANKGARVSSLKDAIKVQPVAKSSDAIQDQNVGEETYLFGLKVEGRRIGILVDSSSSMTDELLIDIIRRKSSSDKDKQAGPKWIRAKKVVRWLLSRLPKSSEVSVVTYSANAGFLGGSKWNRADDSAGLSRIILELERVVPTGATNLHKGLMEIQSMSPSASNLYVITDGFPTTGQSRFSGLNPFSSCFSLLGSGTTISGDCRAKLFWQTIYDSSLAPTLRVNVILLPLEGDPLASYNYWEWTAPTGGLLISPAEDWP
jgi:hypothetical protein